MLLKLQFLQICKIVQSLNLNLSNCGKMGITLNDSEKLPSKFVHIQLVALSYVSD